MKYIDIEKLKAEIRRYKNKADERLKIKGRTFGEEQKDLALQNLCGNLLHFIDSSQQEQPEMDLEKEMDMFYGMYRDKTGQTYDIEDNEPCFDWKEDELSEHELHIARHFYELGLKARKEE